MMMKLSMKMTVKMTVKMLPQHLTAAAAAAAMMVAGRAVMSRRTSMQHTPSDSSDSHDG
jgi:hypothetical protein